MVREQHQWQITAVIALGVLIRAGMAPLGGHPGDVPVLAHWAGVINEHGVLAVYALSSANYPPLGMVCIALSARLYALLVPAQAFNPAGALWLVALKTPIILADGALIWLIWCINAEKKRALWLALSAALNPVLIYLSGWWGQLESVYILWGMLAIWLAVRERHFLTGVCLALALLTKQQGIVFTPVVLLILLAQHERYGRLQWRHWGAFLLGGLVTVTARTLPFVLTGQGVLLARRLVALVAAPGWLTVNALNFWYLSTAGAGNWVFNAPLTLPDTQVLFAGWSARQLGLLLLCGWSVLVIWLGWRARRWGLNTWFVTAGLLYLGAFLWPTQAHERYAVAAVPLLAGALSVNLSATCTPPIRRVLRRLMYLYAGLTILVALNLIWAAPFDPVLFASFSSNAAAGLALAALMLVLSLGLTISLHVFGLERENLNYDDHRPHA